MNESIIHSVFQEIDNMRISYDEGYKIINNLSDEFSIGFAKWLSNSYWYMRNDDLWYLSIIVENNYGITSKELLEIYKKEKGL